MAKNTVPRGETSVIRHVFIMDSTSTTGAGKTALAFDTASLTGYYIYPGGTATSLTLETISTLGTYAAPTSNAHLRFKKIDDTNMPGWYELQFHNDWFSVASGRRAACLQLKGATGMAPLNLEIDCIGAAVQDAILPVNATQISGDETAANNCESFFDGTGYAGTNNVIPTVTTVTNQLTAAAIATGVWQDATAGDFTAASSIGKALYVNNVAPGGSGGHFISGSNAGTTTFGALTVTGACTHGSTVFGNTTMGTLTQTGAASLGAGSTVTFGTLGVTGALSVGTTTTLTGAVSAPAGITANITGTITTATNLTNERGRYANGSVWIGPASNTNTVSYTDGIITNPVSTIAAAKTVADALGMRRFEIIRTGTVQISATLAGYRLSGVGWTCTTTGGSQDVGTTAFLGGNVASGTFASTSGTINWVECEFATGVSIGVSNLVGCRFQGTLTLNAAGNYDFVDCCSVVAGTATPEFAIPAGTVNVSFRRWSGGIKITGITAGTTVSIDMVSGGTVTLEGVDGNVQVRGMVAGITDSRTGSSITLGQNAAINITKINTECDTALSDIKLDHLVAVADADDVVNNSIIAKLVSASATADWSDFVNTTDSLQAIRDRGDAAWITATGFSTHSAADVASLILVTPAQKIVTNASGYVTYANTAPPTAADIKTAMEAAGGHLALILDDTGASGVAVASGSKTGYALSATGLDSIATTAPTGVASTFREMVVQVWRRFFKKATKTSAQIKTFADDGTTTVTTQAVSDDGTTETQGAAT